MRRLRAGETKFKERTRMQQRVEVMNLIINSMLTISVGMCDEV